MRSSDLRWRFLEIVVSAGAITLLTILAVACTGTAPPPTPAAGPKPAVAPSGAVAQPTAAPAAAPSGGAPKPTMVPATSVVPPVAAAKEAFPQQGRAVTLVVGQPAGGIADASTRALAALLEREFGSPFPVVNKPGASTQIGMTELAQAKPDGYTLGTISLPTLTVTYLDPSRKAVYTRSSFQPIAMFAFDDMTVGVAASGRFKSVKDLVDAARAAPGTISCGTAGQLGLNHMTGLAYSVPRKLDRGIC